MKKSKSHYQEKFSVNFDLPTLDKLRALGTRRGGQSVSSLLRYAVSELLEREQEPPKPPA